MPTIPYKTRQEIIAQALTEISFARQFKQGKVKNWQKNEDLYYSKKVQSEDARANVDLGRMQEFVHTLLSKIDNPLVFKFNKRKESQLKRAKRLNALRQSDQQSDFWDIKDIVGKKQGIIYGRAIYAYYADSIEKKYKAHLEPVDVYDFLIDPSAGGIDMERAMYLGRYGVVKNRSDIQDGMNDGTYLKTEGKILLDGSGNSTDENQEQTNKNRRTNDQNVWTSQKNVGNPDKYVFWEWYTTYDGVRYYLLLSERGGTAIRVEELTDVFASGMWPLWSWAAFPDLTEFWTPSYCDYVREIFMAQAVSINQMLDNAEQVNKPQKVVDTSSIENLAELKYRKDGYIKTRGGDVTKAIQLLQVPPIDTPIKVFEVLESIQEKSSGVTAGAKGLADGNEKATIYQGNQENAADRFGLLNKSYSFGYHRFAELYQNGVKEHLNNKVAVELIGPDGMAVENISKKDIFKADEDFNIIVEASNAETAVSENEKSGKITFLAAQALNPNMNQKKAFEMQASIAGFTEEEIRQLLDTSEFGDAELMSEAEKDIEDILEGKNIKPNKSATTAYKQRFVDYMQDHEDDIDDDTFEKFVIYIRTLDPYIMRNMARAANDHVMSMQMSGTGAVPPPGQPAQPVVQGAQPPVPVA